MTMYSSRPDQKGVNYAYDFNANKRPV